MSQNKKIFWSVAACVCIVIAISIALIATKNTSIQYAKEIPASTLLQSLPPQTIDQPEYTSVITGLPLSVSYTQRRNIQESVGYLADPDHKGVVHRAVYREGSVRTDADGVVTFLVDVLDTKRTFSVRDNQTVNCADQNEQKEASWSCAMPIDGDFE